MKIKKAIFDKVNKEYKNLMAEDMFLKKCIATQICPQCGTETLKPHHNFPMNKCKQCGFTAFQD